MNNYYLFWDLLPPEQQEDPTIAPRKIDLRMFGLTPKPVIRLGHKVSTIYFKNIDFTEPIFKCDRVANYEGNQPVSLTRTVAFRKSSGSWGGSSTYTVAIYDPLAFWQKRRSRIIGELKKLAADTGLSAQILPVFEEYQTFVDSYRDAGSPKFRDAIANSSEAWLDTDYLIGNTGMIAVPSTGSAITDGQDVEVNYQSKEERITTAFTANNRNIYLRFDGLNRASDNKEVIIEIYKARFNPSEMMAMINEEHATYDLNGMALFDKCHADKSVYGGYMRIRLA